MFLDGQVSEERVDLRFRNLLRMSYIMKVNESFDPMTIHPVAHVRKPIPIPIPTPMKCPFPPNDVGQAHGYRVAWTLWLGDSLMRFSVTLPQVVS